jgi:NlpC/P60 family protein
MATDGNDIGDYASRFIGTPYVWGGDSLKKGVDCSGLIQQVFKHYGINLPRTTYDMIGEGKAVGLKGLRPGDLMFFDTSSRSGPDHVGIYLGNGKMIHAPRPGKSVEIVDVTKGYYVDTFVGGRRISGVHATGASDSDYEQSPKLTPEELASNYGWSIGFLESNSELKKLFNEAVDGTWTADKFQAELRDTKWWKETSNTRREAQVTKKTDPATWNAQVSAAVIQVRQLAAEIGAAIPESKLKKIAQNVIETGMDENQLRYAIGGYVTFTKKGTLRGEAAMHEYTMKQYAFNMGIKLTDQAIKNQAQRVVRKIATTQDFESEVREQAKSMFPAYADAIDAGSSVRDIAGPYIQTMASELQIPDNSIDVMDPTIKRALNGLDANGKPGGTSLYDFQSQVRNDPRWKKTSNAQNGVMTAGLKVLQDLGLANGPS